MTNANPESSFADLEIRISQRGDKGYPVEITLNGEQHFDGYLAPDIAAWVPSGSLSADGQALLDKLLASKELIEGWAGAKTTQRRIRLRIDPGAADLHALPWEKLHDEGGMLSANGGTPFSRYLPVKLPWGGAVKDSPIRILAAISNPQDLAQEFGLAPIDLAEHRAALQAAESASGGKLQVTFLDPPITLERLEEALRGAPGYHILHYTGHGAFDPGQGQAALHLQDKRGNTDLVTDDKLVGMLSRLRIRPSLVFLAACQSASRATEAGYEGSAATEIAFLGLAPKLVQIGVPAVVAMQDLVAIETARQLTATFYTRLAELGAVDRALNEARGSLQTAGRPDAAVPVLFMRLKSGQLWGDEADARGDILGQAPAAFWPGLMRMIQSGQCIPIIGPRVHGRWLPTPSEAGRALADKFGYPFADRDNLARVAQYLATINGPGFPHLQLLEVFKEAFNSRLPKELQLPPGKLPAKGLAELVQAAGWSRLTADDPNDVHQVLAAFNLPLYLTTNSDSFMSEALAAQGKSPQRELCRWNVGLDDLKLLPEQSTVADPTPDKPMVYHLFGNDTQFESLVLTEDDALDYVVKVSAEAERIPWELVRAKLTNNLLLFVGYSLYDWEFRVLMRCMISTLPQRRPLFKHVAVQFEDVKGTDSREVQNFMKEYFSGAHTNVFWGNTAQFAAELREQWEAAQ